MAATAMRFGSAKIGFDWTHLQGAALNPDELKEATESWGKLKTQFDSGEVAFYHAPAKNEISQLEPSVAMAKKIIASGDFTNVLFLGIGGSSLGPISMLSALDHCRKNSLQFHFKENPDATDWKNTIGRLDHRKTLVCVVTKSGGTFETMSQLMLAMEWLGRERWKSHIVAITDPEKGDLRKLCTAEGIPTLDVHPGVGGRYSIFTPVGLFAGALAGLDMNDFIAGAHKVHKYLEKVAPEKNPLFTVGHHLIQKYKNRPVHVCMPYSTLLRTVGNWWVQLWSESLGKDGKGFSPIAAVGANDQHSLLQLLRDGPDNKVIWFIAIDRVDDEVKIPRIDLTRPLDLQSFAMLQNHSLHELLTNEYRATSMVMTKQSRPHFTINLDGVTEETMGSLYYTLCVLTAFTGVHWGVNPFDQPGVEEGKGYLREMLSKGARTMADDDTGHSAVERLRTRSSD